MGGLNACFCFACFCFDSDFICLSVRCSIFGLLTTFGFVLVGGEDSRQVRISL